MQRIRAARSEVFQAMFERDFKEKTDNKVDLSSDDPDVIQEMLRYLYTNRVENLSNVAAELLSVADRVSSLYFLPVRYTKNLSSPARLLFLFRCFQKPVRFSPV